MALLLAAGGMRAQEDVADIASEDVKVGGDPHKRYFRIGPKDDSPPPAGYALLVILPGGSGSADFHAFCKRIYKNACDDSFVAVQPVAVKWREDQVTIWPTAKNRVPGMEFTTEEFVDEVVRDASRWRKIDRRRIYVLAWSSSGPAAYAISLEKKKLVTGFFIAMSVFRPEWLPGLGQAKGEAYYLYHSPTDDRCAYAMAQEAERALKKAGAKVEFHTYEGGHAWPPTVYPDVKRGIAWLDEQRAR